MKNIFRSHKIGPRRNLRGANLRYADLYDANLRYANLRDANLRGANLRYANLRDANLYGVDLTDADLRYADLRFANLRYANLRDANLRGANLRGANLRDANLYGVDLTDADLRYADLYGVNLKGAALPDFQICPEEGSFIAYKKVEGASDWKVEVVTLLIPSDAERTSTLVGRKCRASHAKVLDGFGRSFKDPTIRYEAGHFVYPDAYDDDIRIECTHGIHFFMTRKEAEEF